MTQWNLQGDTANTQNADRKRTTELDRVTSWEQPTQQIYHDARCSETQTSIPSRLSKLHAYR